MKKNRGIRKTQITSHNWGFTMCPNTTILKQRILDCQPKDNELHFHSYNFFKI